MLTRVRVDPQTSIPPLPLAHGFHAVGYDPAERIVVLFGGGPTREEYTGETWIYDPAANTWSPVS